MEENTLTNICRACLTEEGEFQSVFVADEGSGITIHLAEIIMAYASVQITLGDGLPEKICLSCAQKAVSFYNFKQLCEISDATLRQQLGKSPLNKMFNISDEQQSPADTAVPEPYIIDLNIKPEINVETEEKVNVNELDEESLEVVRELGNKLDSLEHHSDIDHIFHPKCSIEKLACDLCPKVFTRISHLNRHKKVHAVLREYSCEVCNKGFTRNDLLVRHRSIHDIKPEIPLTPYELLDQDMLADNLIEVKSEDYFDELKCIPCDKSFMTREEYTEHMVLHEGRSRNSSGSHRCPECNKKFNKGSHLTRHLKIHAAIKPHVCILCNKGFARVEQLNNHMNAHSGVKPHVCGICAKGFNQVSNLKDHMRTHNGEKPFLCSICGKGFNQLGNLRQHTIRHSGIKAHLCSTCGNGFASKGELGAHLRKHTGARPFVCPICSHGFTTSSSLTKHKRIHSGEKPYECEVCKMRFSRSGILARHKRTHTGEKPYVCKFCTKAFSQSNDLSSHLRIHTGEKPYICDTCGQAFRQSSALKTHKKTHMDRSTILEIERARNLVPMIHNAFINVLP